MRNRLKSHRDAADEGGMSASYSNVIPRDEGRTTWTDLVICSVLGFIVWVVLAVAVAWWLL